MHFENRLQPQVCLLVFPEAPKHAIVTIATRGEDEIWKRNWGISEQSTELIVDGKIRAFLTFGDPECHGLKSLATTC